jgi:O-antigen/teichoic acid export membrane protein
MRAMPVETAADVEPSARPAQRPLTADVLMTFGNKVGVLLLNVAGTIVVARALGPTGRGGIAVAFSFTLLLIQFGNFGLVAANPYFVARDPRRLASVLNNTLWVGLVLGSLLAVAGLTLWALFPSLLRGLSSLEVAVLLIGIPAALTNVLLQSILLAEGRMVAYNGVEFAMAVVMFAGLCIGLIVFDVGLLGAISVMVGATIAGTVAYFVLLRHDRVRLRAPDLGLLRRMLRYGVRIYLAALFAYMVGRVNLLLVNSYLGGVAAGEYSTALAIAEGIHLLPTVVGLNLFPRVARGQGAGNTAAVFRTLALGYGLLCLLTIPLAAPGIRLLYGSAFDAAVSIYYWMLPAMFAYGMVSVLANHFAGRGFPREAVLVWLPGLVLNFAIVMVFVPSSGDANVAALSASIGYSLVLALHMRLFARESGGYRELIPRPREALALGGQMLRVLKPRAAG